MITPTSLPAAQTDLAKLRAVCAALRSFGQPPPVVEVLEGIGLSFEQLLSEITASRQAEAARGRARRSGAQRPRIVHGCGQQLSLSDLRSDPERAETRAVEASTDEQTSDRRGPDRAEPAGPVAVPPAGGGSEEPACLSLDEPLTAELRAAAMAYPNVAPQVDTVWRKFLCHHLDKRIVRFVRDRATEISMRPAWDRWCADELPPRVAPPPQSETRIRAGPPPPHIERARDRQHEEYCRAAVPLPADWRIKIGAPQKCATDEPVSKRTG